MSKPQAGDRVKILLTTNDFNSKIDHLRPIEGAQGTIIATNVPIGDWDCTVEHFCKDKSLEWLGNRYFYKYWQLAYTVIIK